MNKNQLYFLLQIGGWLFYILLALLFIQLQNKEINLQIVTTLFLVFFIGISITHVYREFIIYFGWTQFNITALLPRMLLSIFVVSLLFQMLYSIGTFLMFQQPISFTLSNHIGNILNWNFLIGMWAVIYFAFQFFERYRVEEIKNLKWEATKNEIELNKLKSQLNPHFIFNSMNSIRALIDDNPVKAKRSVTQLANILRNTLMLGRKKTVLFQEEMNVVKDYIELEKTRYEERLNYSESISDDAYEYQLPSLMIQTLIENGIKHGISQIPSGGSISLKAFTQNEHLHITIENSGSLAPNPQPETGFGLINTKQRLQLLYGENAKFDMCNSPNHTVITTLILPKEPI